MNFRARFRSALCRIQSPQHPFRELAGIAAIGSLYLLTALVRPTDSFAHDQQKNRLTITRQDARCINLAFSVSGPLVLHPILGSKQTFDAFINKFAAFSPEAFQKELERALGSIEKDALIKGPDERKLTIQKWVWAAPPLWQQSIQQQRALIMAGAGNSGHPNPLEFTATACGKHPINRLMLGFNPSLYPLFVEASLTDQFWLTADIPTAVADF